MEKIKPKLLEDQDSKGQWLWILFIRIIGVIMFISPLFLPILAYYQSDVDNIALSGGDWFLLLIGFVLSSGGKQIGMILNNAGIILRALMKNVPNK